MIDQEKKQLRATVRSSIMQLTMGQRIYAATRVQHLIRGDADYQQARHIMAFWPLPDEVDIRPLLTNNPDGKKFYLPVVQGDDILVKPYAGPLQTGAFHILEPGTSEVVGPEILDYILVPGVCFDADGHRLGRGRSYYDRFLTQTHAVKAGVCFAAQYVRTLPVDAHDVNVDKVFYG